MPISARILLMLVSFASSIDAVDEDVAGGRLLQVVDAAQQGRFAGAAGADDHDHLPGLDVEVDAAQRLHLAKVFVQIGDADDWIRHWPAISFRSCAR